MHYQVMRRWLPGRMVALISMLVLWVGCASATGISLTFLTPTAPGQGIRFVAEETAGGSNPFNLSLEQLGDPAHARVQGFCIIGPPCVELTGQYGFALTDPTGAGISNLITISWLGGFDPNDPSLSAFDINFYDYETPLDPNDPSLAPFPVAQSIVKSASNYCELGSFGCYLPTQFLFVVGGSWVGIVDAVEPIPEPHGLTLVAVALAAAWALRLGRVRTVARRPASRK